MSNTGRRKVSTSTKEKMKEMLNEGGNWEMVKEERVPLKKNLGEVPLKKNLINTCLYFQSFSSILRYLVFCIFNFGKKYS